MLAFLVPTAAAPGQEAPLEVTAGPASVRLMWSNPPPNSILESVEELSDCLLWEAVPVTPLFSNGQFSVTLPISQTSRLFHLYPLPAEKLPPVWCPLPDQNVIEASTLEVPLHALSPNRVPVTFGAAAPLVNATLDGASGLFRFTPVTAQLGENLFAFYATDGQLFSTQQMRVVALPLPVFEQRGADGSVTLSWSSAVPGFELQESDSLGTNAVWTTVPGTPLLVGGQFQMTLPPSAGEQYFRLKLIPLPPDPSTLAPALPPNHVSSFGEATAFLYTGPNAIQLNVAANAINQTQVAVVRGRVLQQDGTPVAAVQATVLNHPELGLTQTRADGTFDLAVNGGGLVTVRLQRAGYRAVDRTVRVPWQDYVAVPDVILTPLDPASTVVAFGSNAPPQMHRGTPQTDAEGTRQATLLFPAGTTAQLLMPDGSTQAVSSLTIHVTEATVGTNGLAAMPAALPPTSGYTYCADFVAEEAEAAGATRVQFNQPVPVYLENYLGITVGLGVPVGYYDTQLGAWVPEHNGRVIQVLSTNGGLATLDVDGTGQPASSTNLAALGISTNELQRLAALYPPGQSLWRVPLTHFSSLDFNHAKMLISTVATVVGTVAGIQAGIDSVLGGITDWVSSRISPTKQDTPSTTAGLGTVENENQVFHEAVPLAGTTFTLHYSSDRTPGFVADRQLTIPVTGATNPPDLLGVSATVDVAGQHFASTFPPQTNLNWTVTWNGQDAYGRAVQGPVPATIDITFMFPGQYLPPFGTNDLSFARFGDVPGSQVWVSGYHGVVSIDQQIQGTVNNWDERVQGLGGWNLDVHHAYDPAGQILYLGDGQRVSAQMLTSIDTLAVMPTGFNPDTVAMTPDGSVYALCDGGLVRISPDGTQFNLTSPTGPLGGAGFGNINAMFVPVASDLTAGPDGSLYWCENNGGGNGIPGLCRVLRWNPANNAFSVVAGGGSSGYNGDGIPATNALLSYVGSIAVGPDGSVYIADKNNYRIRKVAPGGLIFTVAGNGQRGPHGGSSGDGQLATQTAITPVGLVRLGPDGSLYYNDDNSTLRRITPQGLLSTVGGNGSQPYAQGLAATNWSGIWPWGRDIKIGQHGEVYVMATGDPLSGVFEVQPDGLLRTVAGGQSAGFGGDGGPALQALLNPARGGMGLTPDGRILIAEWLNNRIRVIRPGFVRSGVFVASPDGSELYEFDLGGRHLATLNALTGTALYQFAYDANGHLTQVVDADGNTTTVQHDGSGNPSAIVGPYGATTALAVDANGFLARATDPLGHSFLLTNSSDGLLLSITGPNTNTFQFSYDTNGFFVQAIDPLNSVTTLTRGQSPGSMAVTGVSPLGHTNFYRFEYSPSGVLRHTVTDATGVSTVTLTSSDGGSTTNFQADGTVGLAVQGPDPRFGLQAPLLAKAQITTPSGLTQRTVITDQAGLTNAQDPLSLLGETNVVVSNEQTNTTSYDAASRTFLTTSPEGRQKVVVTDAVGRPVFSQAGGFAPWQNTYDSQGRLAAAQWGNGPDARTFSYAYDTNGNLAMVVSPLGQTNLLSFDIAGRLLSLTLADGRVLGFGYDANGNLTLLTPPGRPAHAFALNALNLPTQYSPPPLDGTPTPTLFTYDADRRVTEVQRPAGVVIQYAYDDANRLTAIQTATDNIAYHYDTNGVLTNISSTASGIGCAFRHDGWLLTDAAWSGPVAGQVSLAYDANFRLAAFTVNGSNTVAYAYDADELITNAGPMALVRDTNGLVIQATLGALAERWGYNQFAEVTNHVVSFSNDVLFAASYVRDGLGRVTHSQEVIAGGTRVADYQYDLAGRLVQVSTNGSISSQYVYDDNDNRLQGPSSTETATYDAQDRLIAGTFNGHSYTFSNSLAGDLLAKSDGAQSWGFTHNALRSLTQVIGPDGLQVDFLLDGLGRRVGKQVNGTMTRELLFLDTLHPIAQLDGSGALVSQFVYAIGGNHAPDFLLHGGAAYRLVTDQLGSVRLVVNAQTGEIAQQLDYDEFGRALADSNPGFQPFGFAGGLYEPEIGQVHFGSRDYDPELGRWLVKDTFNFGGGQANLYAYAANAPVNFRDPTGAGSIDTSSPTLPGLPDIHRIHADQKNYFNNLVNGASDEHWHGSGEIARQSRNEGIQQAGYDTMQGARVEVQILGQAGVSGLQPANVPIGNVPIGPGQGETVLTAPPPQPETANNAVLGLAGNGLKSTSSVYPVTAVTEQVAGTGANALTAAAAAKNMVPPWVPLPKPGF